MKTKHSEYFFNFFFFLIRHIYLEHNVVLYSTFTCVHLFSRTSVSSVANGLEYLRPCSARFKGIEDSFFKLNLLQSQKLEISPHLPTSLYRSLQVVLWLSSMSFLLSHGKNHLWCLFSCSAVCALLHHTTFSFPLCHVPEVRIPISLSLFIQSSCSVQDTYPFPFRISGSGPKQSS